MGKDMATDPLMEEADKNLKLAQKRYKQHYDLHIQFAPIFPVGDSMFLDKPPLFRLAAERSALKSHNKFIPENKGPTN